MDRTGYVLTSSAIAGTLAGALVALAILPFAKYGSFEDVFAILISAGHGVGWVVGFLKLGAHH